jgi:hypothetical protein
MMKHMKNSYNIETIKNKKIISEYINEFGTPLLFTQVRQAILSINKIQGIVKNTASLEIELNNKKKELSIIVDNIYFLLNLGIDINKPNAKNITPLMIAVEAKQQIIANFLVDKGAKINPHHLLDTYKERQKELQIIRNLAHDYHQKRSLKNRVILSQKYLFNGTKTIFKRLIKFSIDYIIKQTILCGYLNTLSVPLLRITVFPDFLDIQNIQNIQNILTPMLVGFARNEIVQGILRIGIVYLPESERANFINDASKLMSNFMKGYFLYSVGFQLYSYYSNQPSHSTATPRLALPEKPTFFSRERVNSIVQTCSWGSIAADPLESGLAFPNRLEKLPSLTNPLVSRSCSGNSGTLGV